MSETPKLDRKKLGALLEGYGGSLATWDNLRTDSYEKALAGSDTSLERLEQFYSEIFFPDQPAEKARPKCPVWPPGTPFAGELPGLSTINKIVARFNTESTLNGLGPIQAFLEKFRKSISGTSIGNNDQVTDAVIALAGQELIKAHQSGKPISENLEVVSALQYERRTKLKEREIANRERALDLLVKKYEDERNKAKAALTSDTLTPEEKEARVKEIFGL